ncbi:hypothetical protein GCM10007382_21550 [Salinibacterium xinjiangense]|uniref:Peptidase family M23 n=1 Tax=Salinibacterium xinjiangense TaxID=386302 RepID=A0A2C8ZX93_9MICO|nr:M23 family metallopeptidase [Salinibacterium xinjiangense]GGL01312.1 hypothetical protein GCM10007382_21550 [Salinibacterium xinjiangense]SOE70621.1 Peptidase family M23 [Salinibacterium xinjiangense]
MLHESRTPASDVPPIHPARPHGILRVIRSRHRALMLAVIAVLGLLSSLPSLPQEAFASAADGEAVRVQALTTSPATRPAPQRDGFAISTFSVVQWPVLVSTPISSGFGLRDCDGCSTDHSGTDFNPGSGFPVQAISAGVVTEAGWDSTGYGNKVIVQHVVDGQVVSSLYAHLQERSLAVSVGDVVLRGQQLALVGSTGQSTGAHLHLSIIIDDVMIDPYPWLVAHVNS